MYSVQFQMFHGFLSQDSIEDGANCGFKIRPHGSFWDPSVGYCSDDFCSHCPLFVAAKSVSWCKYREDCCSCMDMRESCAEERDSSPPYSRD